MRAGLLDVAVTERVWFSLVAPEDMPLRFTVLAAEFSSTVMLLRAARVGGSLTGFTVTVKVRETTLFEVPPSLTVTVIIAEPLAFAAGVNLSEPVEAGLV